MLALHVSQIVPPWTALFEESGARFVPLFPNLLQDLYTFLYVPAAYLQSALLPSTWLSWMPWRVELAATLILVASLAYHRLHLVYRFFFVYLAADAIETIAALIFHENRRIYSEIYFAGQGIRMLLAVFVVLEIYRIALAGQPALARYGKTTVSYVLATAAVVAVAGFWIDQDSGPGRDAGVRRFVTFERTMDAWMLLFLLMISAFMIWFPVRLKRNNFLYIGGFVIYFLARSLGLLFSNIAPLLISKLDNWMVATQIMCLILWTIALQPAGEKISMEVGHRWDPEAAGRLKDQLSAINAALLRMSRR